MGQRGRGVEEPRGFLRAGQARDERPAHLSGRRQELARLGERRGLLAEVGEQALQAVAHERANDAKVLDHE